MRQLIISIAAGLLLTACADGGGVSPQDKNTAARAVYSCLSTSVAQLDDGYSDASTIGVAALGTCRNELVAEFDAEGAVDSAGQAESFSRAQGVRIATTLVLQHRRSMGLGQANAGEPRGP